MAYQKLKQEQYINVGGISTKASVYVTDDRSVLDLVNYDLQTTAAWTQRPGITNAISGQTLSLTPGANQFFYFGGQASKLDPLTINGATILFSSYLIGNTSNYFFSLSAAYIAPVGPTLGFGTSGKGNLVNAIGPGKPTVGAQSFYNNAYFSANKGSFRANYVSLYYYGLPKYADGLTAIPASGSAGTGSLSGTYNFRICYAISEEQYVGSPGLSFSVSVSGASQILLSGFTLTNRANLSGADQLYIYSNRVFGLGTDEYGLVDFTSVGSTAVITGLTAGLIQPRTTASSLFEQNLTLIDKVPSTRTQITSLYNEYEFVTGNADCVEFFGDRLYWGQSSGNNLIFFSEPIEFIGNAQDVLPENFILTKNNNYSLVGLKAYNQALIIFFQKGVNRLTGDNLANFNQQELTSEYGLVNSRCIVEFRERLWFLDEKDIIEYNGANFQPVSLNVQSYLSRMNLEVARNTATAYHYERRKEVWFAIPIDGSTSNNIILVFDYNASGWYVIKSPYAFYGLIELSQQSLSTGNSSANVVFTNTNLYTSDPSSGYKIGYFGENFKLDYDSSFTLTFKTKYHSAGLSTTNEWRRFYLDNGPWAGVTLSFSANMYANFATSTVAHTATIYASGSPYSGPQQTRIDFGVPAKSLSVETHIATGASLPIIRVYGYTIESRFLRNV